MSLNVTIPLNVETNMAGCGSGLFLNAGGFGLKPCGEYGWDSSLKMELWRLDLRFSNWKTKTEVWRFWHEQSATSLLMYSSGTVYVSVCREEECVWFEGGMQQLIKEAGGAIFRLGL